MARIALVTDTHTWTRPEPLLGSGGNVLLLDHAHTLHQILLAEIGRSSVDALVHLGDMTCGGGYFDMPAAAFSPALCALHDDYRASGLPVFALPGNHDCQPGGGDWSLFEALWGLESGQGHTLDLDGIRLLLINAQGHDAAQRAAAAPADPVYGWVSENELARIDAALATAHGRPVVVGIHQLLYPWATTQPMPDFYGVLNAAAVLDRLARHSNICAVFQGHAHLYEVQQRPLAGRSIPFIIAPAVIESPAAWLLLETGRSGLSVELRPLPLTDGMRDSIRCGSDPTWRAGDPASRRFTIPW